ncbi:MAG: imidazoleglycerol-phosphate dehydratase HisB [Cellulosilyticaceae bacterium]
MRYAQINRATLETQIELKLELDGCGETTIDTGIGFFNHMLTHIGRHSLCNLHVHAVGDLEVDCHHTVEDVGIVLGQALKEALGEKCGIARYGHSMIPMEEALVLCAIDCSGRPYSKVDACLTTNRVGDFDTEMVGEFFRAVAIHGGLNVHIKVLEGTNNHHMIEGMCKAFARALRMAITPDPRELKVPSTKGMLEG